MSTAFNITGIDWENPEGSLPSAVILSLPGWLTNLGYEDFEQEGLTDDFDDDDWEGYEPSIEAQEAFEAEWHAVICMLLKDQFGQSVRSLGGYEPR